VSSQPIEAPHELLTPRLILRAPHPDFADETQEAIRETFPELKRWMIWAQKIPTREELQSFFTDVRAKFLAKEAFNYVCFLRSNNQFAGTCGFSRLNWNERWFEIGYWLRKSLMHQGYITEAVKGLTEFAFTSFQAKRVEIHMSDLNEASWRVAERAGFRLERIIPADSVHPDGSLRDTRIYFRKAE